MSDPNDVTRRSLLAGTAAAAGIATAPALAREPVAPRKTSSRMTPKMPVSLTVNGQAETLTLDPRVTLLDALREHLHLTGSKKGCDHGQ